jgi:carbonic anhydrase
MSTLFTRFLLAFAFLPMILGASELKNITPEQSLKLLVEGNKRYANDQLLHPNHGQDRREAVTAKQTPFATILGCSDSRVAPEILFDQGIGDLFVVRVAGNVLGPVEIGSIEFSAVYLHSSLIVVLGHENCGAVNAALTGETKDIEAITNKIRPALIHAAQQPGNALENAVKDNVRMVVGQVKNSAVIAKLIQEKKVNVVGGYYRLTTGEVELLR